MKLRSAVAECISRVGADTVFGVLGGGNMYMVNELVHTHGLRYVAAAREDGAILMANAYARVSGQLGLATVTYGPGLTNAITAITEAARARTPMIVLTGHAPANAVPSMWQGLQTIDHEMLVRPTGAAYHTVKSMDSAMADVGYAIRTAVLERRPVVLGIPTDLQELDGSFDVPRDVFTKTQAGHPDPEALDDAVGIIASANRCVVLAGYGAVLSGARAQLIELAQRLKAPLATTLLARDYFAGNSSDIGIFGGLSSGPAGDAISRADCIIAVGASLNRLTSHNGTLLAGKRIVHCDADPASIGRHLAVDSGVVGDAAVTVEAINVMLEEVGMPADPAVAVQVQASSDGLRPSGYSDEVDSDEDVPVHAVLRRLDALLPVDRTVTVDSGRFAVSALRHLRAPDPRSFVPPLSFLVVGCGIAAAVGAAFARPDRPAVLIAGDGGMMMSLSELHTAVQNNLNVVIVVVNNDAYAQEILRFEVAGMDTGLAHMKAPDFALVAKALGARGVTVRSMADLDAIPEAVRHGGGPLVIDVKINLVAQDLKLTASH